VKILEAFTLRLSERGRIVRKFRDQPLVILRIPGRSSDERFQLRRVKLVEGGNTVRLGSHGVDASDGIGGYRLAGKTQL
jgi:hypothetical protein